MPSTEKSGGGGRGAAKHESRGMAEYEQIRCELAQAILTITLSRPERLNAYTPTMRDELIHAFTMADVNDDVRAIVVTGAGRAFCAGVDLALFDFERRAPDGDVPRDGGGQVTLRIFECRKPVIAAINGAAVGFGLTMVLPMDIRVVATEAKLGFVFSRRGIVPEAASTWFLPRIVGLSRAAEWMYSGRMFDAAEALDAGLVRSVHTRDDVLGVAQALALEIVENAAPISVALTRQLIWRGLTLGSPYESHIAESRALQITGRSADAREGVASMQEKRPSRFVGRVSTDALDIWSDPQPNWAVNLPRTPTHRAPR
jgi:enoyl-CoA hydratase/carnithine racemase